MELEAVHPPMDRSVVTIVMILYATSSMQRSGNRYLDSYLTRHRDIQNHYLNV